MCSILSQRLLEYIVSLNILHKSQIGFLPNNRTADRVFTLRTLIDEYVHNHNEKIYASVFVDYKKAFYSVWHDGLLNKLLQIDFGGSFYNLIKSLFHSSSCSIKIAQKQTRSFRFARGVRQGCILSPLLFSLYINDLPFAFENTLPDPFVLPNGAKLNFLLYADDLIILSRSKTGPQNCLDKLSSFCTSWIMKINPKINLVDSQIIDVEQEYTYLGTRMSSSGNFSVSREHLKEKALHALFSLR